MVRGVGATAMAILVGCGRIGFSPMTDAPGSRDSASDSSADAANAECTADVDCASGVCIEHDSTCIPEGEALYVDSTATGTDCTRTAPCATIAQALVRVTALRHTIRLADGTYPESVTLQSPTRVTISGPDIDTSNPVIDSNNTPGTIAVISASTLIVEGVQIASGVRGVHMTDGTVRLYWVRIEMQSAEGIQLIDGDLAIFAVEVVESQLTGLTMDDGVLRIDRSRFDNNDSGALEFATGAFAITNSMFVDNGNPSLSNGGILFSGSLTGTFEYNTVARNVGQAGSFGIECQNSPIDIASSIVVDNGAGVPQISTGCTASYSLFSTTAPPMTNNIVADPQFVAPGLDYHVMPTSPAIGRGNAPAPDSDFDGQPRDATPDVGADEYVP